MIQRNEANLQLNWQKELANVVTSPEILLKMLNLSGHYQEKDFAARSLFNVRVPRPFIAKMKPGDPNDPLLLQVLPRHQEFLQQSGFIKDPLEEQNNNQPGLLHKYRSRVLLMLKTACAVNCRYCFRRHFPYQENHLNKQAIRENLGYIAAHPEINEVILSGGDPLMAKDDALAWLVGELEKMPQITRLRIHSRLPAVIPARITDELCEILGQSRLKVIFVNHINHANEIDQALVDAMARLKRAGTVLLNQAVLLKDINDSSDAQIALSERLFEADILPYYLHLLDKVEGASHFYISDERAREILADMLSALPGFLVPKLVREIGGEKSKTPIDLQLA